MPIGACLTDCSPESFVSASSFDPRLIWIINSNIYMVVETGPHFVIFRVLYFRYFISWRVFTILTNDVDGCHCHCFPFFSICLWWRGSCIEDPLARYINHIACAAPFAVVILMSHHWKLFESEGIRGVSQLGVGWKGWKLVGEWILIIFGVGFGFQLLSDYSECCLDRCYIRAGLPNR